MHNRIAKRLNLRPKNVANTVTLLNDGATVPFISRYRKELTGSMDEVQIGDIRDLLQKLTEMDKRRETILTTIEEQGKLTPELRRQIEQADTLTELEDLYLPYKPKRKTRATKARERGLEPLADIIFDQRERDIEHRAEAFLTDEVETIEDALQGARDIIAERVSEDAEVRNRTRRLFEKDATVKTKLVRGKEEEGAKYRDYFKYEEALRKCPSHRLLAIRRAEDEGILRVGIAPDEERAFEGLARMFVENNSAAAAQVEIAVKDAYKRLIQPSIETEFRNLSKEKADIEAIRVFAENLRQLLLASPLGQKRVMAIDPGFRSGCKVVCLDEQGTLLHHTAIFPHPPQRHYLQAMSDIMELVDKYEIEAIAIGNGTAGRETEQLVSEAKFETDVQLFMVSENGASVYSASAVAREEFPDKDVTVRGAVSIGRRLMDPLAELVKIDAKSIGVGQYQHDVDQNLLKKKLDEVVESSVNRVGVNLNTASKHLLTYVSGLGPKLAQNVVDFRTENGAFTSRAQIKKVARMGAKAYEQSAGFLRIRDAKNPLDNTAVHPESYSIVKQMAKDSNCSVQDLIEDKETRQKIDIQRYVTDSVGLPTLKDILKELEKPGLDPRGEAQTFSFSEGIKKIEDVEIGMIVPGIVTNITNFGCFVDIGVKQDGMVHISQLANKFVKDPNDIVKLHQHVEVKVMDVDLERSRITLSMKEV